jgi:Transposase
MTAVTVLPSPERRRRWTTAEKLRIVEESLNAGISVVEFARQRDLHPIKGHGRQRQAKVAFLSPLDRSVSRITAFLFYEGSDEMPPVLHENARLSYVGCDIKGHGFLFGDGDSWANPTVRMAELLSQEPQCEHFLLNIGAVSHHG